MLNSFVVKNCGISEALFCQTWA